MNSKAALTLKRRMTVYPLGEIMYGEDCVTAKAEDSIGLLWFTPKGETKSDHGSLGKIDAPSGGDQVYGFSVYTEEMKIYETKLREILSSV